MTTDADACAAPHAAEGVTVDATMAMADYLRPLQRTAPTFKEEQPRQARGGSVQIGPLLNEDSGLAQAERAGRIPQRERVRAARLAALAHARVRLLAGEVLSFLFVGAIHGLRTRSAPSLLPLNCSRACHACVIGWGGT